MNTPDTPDASPSDTYPEIVAKLAGLEEAVNKRDPAFVRAAIAAELEGAVIEVPEGSPL